MSHLSAWGHHALVILAVRIKRADEKLGALAAPWICVVVGWASRRLLCVTQMVHLGQHLCSQPPSIWPGRSGLLPGDPRFDDQNDVADSKLHRLHGQREAGGVRGLQCVGGRAGGAWVRGSPWARQPMQSVHHGLGLRMCSRASRAMPCPNYDELVRAVVGRRGVRGGRGGRGGGGGGRRCGVGRWRLKGCISRHRNGRSNGSGLISK